MASFLPRMNFCLIVNGEVPLSMMTIFQTNPIAAKDLNVNLGPGAFCK